MGPMRTTLPLLLLFLHSSFLIPDSSLASDAAAFLPPEPLFQPLRADPREARSALVRSLGRPQWEGSLGRNLDLVQWGSATRKAWGITGAAFACLGQDGWTFPMQANDWWLGSYLSRSRGRLSQRLEYMHVSSHLGDAFLGARTRIVYSRERFRLLLSARPAEGLRAYAGAGYWVKILPEGDPWCLQTGFERDSCAGRFLGRRLDLSFAYDLKYRQEAGGSLNHSARAGFALRRDAKTGHAVRMEFGFTDGLSEFGQFHNERSRRWTTGLYFD